MPELSLHIEIEATNLCNTRCLHCPHEAITRPSGKMSWEVYQRLVDQALELAPTGLSVEFAGMGEPLLHPQIYHFIEHLSSAAKTILTTNASALTPKNMQRLAQAGLSQLTISFNGADPQLYELMMGGLSFERARENLKTALEISQNTRTLVAANVSVTRQTQGRLAEIRGFLQEAGVERIYFSKCHNRGGFLKGDLVCDTPPPPAGLGRCDILRNTLFVAWDGRVLSCCHDLAGANLIGDTRAEPLAEILQKRQKILSKGVKYEICASCNDLYRFMFSPTPDGRPLGELVYDLYAGDEPADPSPLSAWLAEIYAQQGQLPRLLERFQGRVQEQEQAIRSLSSELKAKESRLQAVQQQLDELLSSRSWRWAQRLQRLRRALIPPGGREY
jgi:pyruvate-formate lyase-activating enzyme